jgi:hypothetical protein
MQLALEVVLVRLLAEARWVEEWLAPGLRHCQLAEWVPPEHRHRGLALARLRLEAD